MATERQKQVARFDQVERVSDKERDHAWTRILRAAREHGADVSETDSREQFKRGKAPKR